MHPGWKDSDDAVFHRDGRPAESPIALCEVQGYADEALRRGADLAERLGRSDQADYPVACWPRAWASGAVLMLIQAMLGLDFEPDQSRVRLRRPRLPDYLGSLTVRRLRHRDGELDFSVHRKGEETAVRVENRVGDIELVVTL